MEDKRVDESWKKKVEDEKHKFGSPQQEPKKGGASPPPEAGPPVQPTGGSVHHGGCAEGITEGMTGEAGMPEAGFINFISGLATQALMALGQVEHPVTKQTEIDLDQARYLIDILEMLKQKTKGNLLPEEVKTIETLLYNLKMVYVRVSKTAKA
jgi:hypothetical protein